VGLGRVIHIMWDHARIYLYGSITSRIVKAGKGPCQSPYSAPVPSGRNQFSVVNYGTIQARRKPPNAESKNEVKVGSFRHIPMWVE
jgi:hypothetical protein